VWFGEKRIYWTIKNKKVSRINLVVQGKFIVSPINGLVITHKISNMKYPIFSLFFIGLIFSCQNDSKGKKKSLSPPATAMAMVGDAHIHIDYSSPGVRGRTIFGKLIPYGELWRAGANQATSIETNKDLFINGQTLAASKYGIFAIPNKDKWTLIINKNWDQHGTDKYDVVDDVLKMDVQVAPTEKIQEHLEYRVIKTDEQSGVISLAWENSKVELPFKIATK